MSVVSPSVPEGPNSPLNTKFKGPEDAIRQTVDFLLDQIIEATNNACESVETGSAHTTTNHFLVQVACYTKVLKHLRRR